MTQQTQQNGIRCGLGLLGPLEAESAAVFVLCSKISILLISFSRPSEERTKTVVDLTEKTGTPDLPLSFILCL